MKTVRTKRQSVLMLRLRSYGSYIDEICRLETKLAGRPARLRIDMIGSGEIPSDSALLFRSVLRQRSLRTHITTNARSSLQGAAVLVWLLGDTRLIREDARLFLRSAGPFETHDVWKDRRWFDDQDQEEEDYIRVLQAINEFLPVRELVGRSIELSVLRQFGLVDNEQVDRFLAAAFQKEAQLGEKRSSRMKRQASRKSAGQRQNQ